MRVHSKAPKNWSNSVANGKLSHEELIRQLTLEDGNALGALAQNESLSPVPPHQACRLLRLGLAEFAAGRLVPTKAGITARAVLRDLSSTGERSSRRRLAPPADPN